MVRRHKGDQYTFGELGKAGQARSINGQIRSLEMAIEHYVDKRNGTAEKLIAQIERLVERLKKKYGVP